MNREIKPKLTEQPKLPPRQTVSFRGKQEIHLTPAQRQALNRWKK